MLRLGDEVPTTRRRGALGRAGAAARRLSKPRTRFFANSDAMAACVATWSLSRGRAARHPAFRRHGSHMTLAALANWTSWTAETYRRVRRGRYLCSVKTHEFRPGVADQREAPDAPRGLLEARPLRRLPAAERLVEPQGLVGLGDALGADLGDAREPDLVDGVARPAPGLLARQSEDEVALLLERRRPDARQGRRAVGGAAAADLVAPQPLGERERIVGRRDARVRRRAVDAPAFWVRLQARDGRLRVLPDLRVRGGARGCEEQREEHAAMMGSLDGPS